VVGGDVLLQGEACTEAAVAGDGTDPVFAIEVFGLEMRGEKDVVVGEEEIELTVLKHLFDGGLPGEELEGDAETRGWELAAKAWEKCGTGVIGSADAEVAAFAAGIEDAGRNESFHGRKQAFELLKDFAAAERRLKAGSRPDEEVVAECGARTLQGSADCGLREQKAFSGCGDGFLFGDDGEGDEQVQVDLAKFL